MTNFDYDFNDQKSIVKRKVEIYLYKRSVSFRQRDVFSAKIGYTYLEVGI